MALVTLPGIVTPPEQFVHEKRHPMASFLVPTFARPPYYLHLLSEVVECFVRQDWPADRREMVILTDTPGQTLTCSAPGVRVVNLPARIRSLGEKRNELCRLAAGDIFLVQDDDDLSLPRRTRQAIDRLTVQGVYDYFNPRRSWWLNGRELHSGHAHGYCHNASAFTRQAWERAGGYPDVSVTEDRDMDARLMQSVKVAPPLDNDIKNWSAIYRWGHSDCHISGGGNPERDWKRRGEGTFQPGTWEIIPGFRPETVSVLAEIERRCQR